jgi:phage shock protein A
VTTLFDKVRVAVLGNLHSLLDRVVNTPEGYRQYIRDLEAALAQLRSADDEAVGTGNGYRRQVTELQSRKSELQSDIDLLLGDDDPSNDESALQLQVQLQQIDGQIASLQELIQSNDDNKAKLDEAIEKLERKHQQMVNDLNGLTLKAAATSAQNRAAKAAEVAGAASDAASGASIDSIADHVNHEKDVSDARFARVFDDLASSTSPEEQADLARAKAALEARRAEIAGHATQEPPATT